MDRRHRHRRRHRRQLAGSHRLLPRQQRQAPCPPLPPCTRSVLKGVNRSLTSINTVTGEEVASCALPATATGYFVVVFFDGVAYFWDGSSESDMVHCGEYMAEHYLQSLQRPRPELRLHPPCFLVCPVVKDLEVGVEGI